MAKKNIVGIAKSTKKDNNVKKVVDEKKKEPVQEALTPEQQKELKAKEMVDKLLKDSEINKLLEPELKTSEESQESIVQTEPKTNVWLEEQFELVSNENDKLKQIINDLQNNGSDGEIKRKVVELFGEIQYNLLRMGFNQQTGRANLIIEPIQFLDRMINFFPFLEDYRKK